jgi:predicted TIM-barrel fold metal-dependent hydrolase
MLFDAHFHIIDPAFPLQENQGFFPEPFTKKDYAKWMKKLGIQGGAIVSGSFQGFDTTYLESALKTLGPQFVGVIQAPHSISDLEIIRLYTLGVRAVRFNMKRGGSETLDHLETFAQRIYDLTRWHVELYIDSSELTPLMPRLKNLPAVSIDHLGLSNRGLPALLELAAKGGKIKASGFGRVDFEVLPALKKIYAENPDSLLFGTDLPSTRAKRPFSREDLTLIQENFSQEEAEKILWKNALEFYS